MDKGLIIRERYEATCMGYDELYGEEQFEKYEVVINRYGVSGRILDAGCGTALLAEYLRERELLDRVDSYVCLDYSGCMLSIARRRLQRLLPKRHLVLEGNVEKLPFPPAYFDFVYSFTVLDLVDDIEEALAELSRVARGPVIVSMLKKLPYKDRLLTRYPLIAVTSKDVIFRVS